MNMFTNRRPFCLLCLFCVLMLAGCDQQALFEKFIPKEEANTAKTILAQVAAREYDAVEKQLDSTIRTATIRNTLEQMAATFPPEDPKAVSIIGSNTHRTGDVTTYNLTFEHEYPNAWLLTNVVLQRRDGQLSVLGLHVRPPTQQSLKEVNRFSLTGKKALHYVVLAFAVAVPVFIVFALVVCVRTPMVKRKWLWLLFVALGFCQFSLNWTDGSYRIQPISFAILGAGFFRAGPYAPYILNFTIPVGAIVFLARRKSLAVQRDTVSANEIPVIPGAAPKVEE